MSLPAFRIVVVASTLLVTATVAFAFFGCPEIGSAYVMVVNSAGSELPRLTAVVSVPLLRIGPGDAHERPVTKTWVALVWFFLALSPIAVAAWTLRAPTLELALARWAAGYSLYVPFVCGIAMVVLVGLALPIACM